LSSSTLRFRIHSSQSSFVERWDDSHARFRHSSFTLRGCRGVKAGMSWSSASALLAASLLAEEAA